MQQSSEPPWHVLLANNPTAKLIDVAQSVLEADALLPDTAHQTPD